MKAKSVNGILLLNKPVGLTSNAVLQRAKRLFSADKAGHTGSLDPLATGMLPVCFGEATKFSQYMLDADKCYQATGLLGVKTTTADAMGDVIAKSTEFTITWETLQETLSLFSGTIKQTPSMFSALKHQGVPLYRYAREGISIDRPARETVIHSLQLDAFDGRQFNVTVTCSKGTYIRNLVEDIGDALGVGAHVTQLHRCFTAGFESFPMFTLEALTELTPEERLGHLLPVDQAIHAFPSITLDDHELLALQQGRQVNLSSPMAPEASLVRLYNTHHQFYGLGDLQSQTTLRVKRLIAL